jgi:hypothetical protein
MLSSNPTENAYECDSDIITYSAVKAKWLPVVYKDVMGDIDVAFSGNRRFVIMSTRQMIPDIP